MNPQELLKKLRHRIDGTSIWRTAGPDEDLQAMETTLVSQVSEVERLKELLEKAGQHIENLAAVLELFKDQWPGFDYDHVVSISYYDAVEFLSVLKPETKSAKND